MQSAYLSTHKCFLLIQTNGRLSLQIGPYSNIFRVFGGAVAYHGSVARDGSHASLKRTRSHSKQLPLRCVDLVR